MNYVKLCSDAVLEKANDYAAGFDLRACSIEATTDGQFIIGTGISVEIPLGHVGMLCARSSVFKKGAFLSNCVGIIDTDYRGEVKAIFRSLTGEAPYQLGERCCQLVVIPLYDCTVPKEVWKLSETSRGENGFGSTGK